MRGVEGGWMGEGEIGLVTKRLGNRKPRWRKKGVRGKERMNRKGGGHDSSLI